MPFLDRTDAGRQLANPLRAHQLHDPIVIGISRGGVPVAAEVARQLGAPLEICVVRKLVTRCGRAIGAVAECGGLYFEDIEYEATGLRAEELYAALQHEIDAVAAKAALLRDARPLSVAGRDVILVDDGVVIASMIGAAVQSLRRQRAARIVLAVPAGNTRVLAELRDDLDAITCLESDDLLVAVGSRYADFSPVSEAEVVDTLASSRRWASTSSSASSSAPIWMGLVR